MINWVEIKEAGCIYAEAGLRFITVVFLKISSSPLSVHSSFCLSGFNIATCGNFRNCPNKKSVGGNVYFPMTAK